MFKKLLVLFLSFILKFYVSLLFLFAKVKFDVSKESANIIKKKAFIILFWHDRLLLFPHIVAKYYKRKAYAIVSSHKDGKYLIDFLSVYGHKAIAGSSNRDPIKTLRSALKVLKRGDGIAITPDGPRGPRHKLHSNVVALSLMCNVPIILCSYSASYAKIFKSWDKFILPIPFLTKKLFIEIMPPIYVDKFSDSEIIKDVEDDYNVVDDNKKISKKQQFMRKNIEELMNQQVKRLDSYVEKN